jgi:hypothetical protein
MELAAKALLGALMVPRPRPTAWSSARRQATGILAVPESDLFR